MKITILNTNDISGGAARAMYRLHQGLLLNGNNSILISTNKKSNDPSVVELDSVYKMSVDYSLESSTAEFIQDSIFNNRSSATNTIFSFPYPDWDISNHPRIIESDIINLHWVAYFQSARTIQKLIQMGKPIVWTLHDEWAFTGGCHYSVGCDGFQNECKNCPQLNIKNSLIPKFVLEEKLNAFQDKITIVTPSLWLGNQAKKSRLFRNSRVEVIPNAIDTDIFHPTAKHNAKAHWEIPEDTFTILFGAENGNERRKGFQELGQSLQLLRDNPKWQTAVNYGKIHIMLFGMPSDDLKNLGIPFTNLGQIHDDTKLALAYSAADLFVLPSLEDNLPNTMLESLSCETPIVAFQAGGMIDMVLPGKTGYIADHANPSSLADKIFLAYESPSERIALGKSGREWMVDEFQLSIQAKKYKELFDDILKNSIANKDVSKKIYPNKKEIIPPEIIEEAIANSKELLFNGYSNFKHHKNYSSSSAQIFFADDGKYDYNKGILCNISTSTKFNRFSLVANTNQVIDFNKNVPHITTHPSEVIILPSMRNPFALRIDKMYLLLGNGGKISTSLDTILTNHTEKDGSTYLFLHGHGYLTIPFHEKDTVGVELEGEWKMFESWEAAGKLINFIAQKDSILNSRVNRISMKIGKFLVSPLKWLYLKLRKLTIVTK